MKAKQTTIIVNGQTLDLLDLKKHQVTAEKMFKGLNSIIRFNGYSGWSVAKHTKLLSKVVGAVVSKLIFLAKKDDKYKKVLKDLMLEMKNETSYFLGFDITEEEFLNFAIKDALIHDFGECLMGDTIRPIKLLFPEIAKFEDKIDTQIRQFHNAPKSMTSLINILDKHCAIIEAYYLTRFHGKTLINEEDVFQLKHFNETLLPKNELGEIINEIIGFDDIVLEEPLSNQNLNKFLALTNDLYIISNIYNESEEHLIRSLTIKFDEL